MSVVIRLKVPIEMHYTVIPMGTSKVNSSRPTRFSAEFCNPMYRYSRTFQLGFPTRFLPKPGNPVF